MLELCLVRVLRRRFGSSRDGERFLERARERDMSFDRDLECRGVFDRFLDLVLDRDLDLCLERSSLSFDSILDFSLDSDLARLDFLADRRVDLPSLVSLSSDRRREERDFLTSESRLESRLLFFEYVLSSRSRFLLCFSLFSSLLFSAL